MVLWGAKIIVVSYGWFSAKTNLLQSSPRRLASRRILFFLDLVARACLIDPIASLVLI